MEQNCSVHYMIPTKCSVHYMIPTKCSVHYMIPTKSSVHYMIPTKSSAQNGISTVDLDMEITFKTGHNQCCLGRYRGPESYLQKTVHVSKMTAWLACSITTVAVPISNMASHTGALMACSVLILSSDQAWVGHTCTTTQVKLIKVIIKMSSKA